METLKEMFAWSRVRVAALVSFIPFVLMTTTWTSGPHTLLARTTLMAVVGLLVFGVLERWPHRLPRRLPRWVAQILGVALAMPVTMFVFYVAITPAGAPQFWEVQERIVGFGSLSVFGLLLAPWAALIALVRQKDVLVQNQAMKLERQAAESRLALLQAQVQPHFLFNTLANLRELVQSQSPQAPAVIESLIAYLRAAVPRLHEPVSDLGRELELVRAYLELMHMRMPDRLQYAIEADEATFTQRCPPLTLLTLVENAVRHGIDPAEKGGRIEIRVRAAGERVRCEVQDTGVGLQQVGGSLGTGLAALRERLRLVFGDKATLGVESTPPGVTAIVELPVEVSRSGPWGPPTDSSTGRPSVVGAGHARD